jgi:hypothetical protein
MGDPSTGQCEPIGGLCMGELAACDGLEDCADPSTLCCKFGFGPFCAPASSCVPGQGGTPICHGAADCPDDRPFCCAQTCAAEACP